MLLLLLAHAAAVLAWACWLVPREVRLNAAAIAADGSANTLHAGFHQRRTWVRAGQAAPLVLLGSWPALHLGFWPALLSLAALTVALAGYFAAVFTPALNRARGLRPYYVSFATGAAKWPDSTLAAKGRAAYSADGAAASQYAERLLARWVLDLALGTVAAYVLVAGSCYFTSH